MKPIHHAACLCALSALLALSPTVALCENTPAENQQAEDSRLQTGKQANLRKLATDCPPPEAPLDPYGTPPLLGVEWSEQQSGCRVARDA